MSSKRYVVRFRESALVEEIVMAGSKREAIELVKNGEGERVFFDMDENRGPHSFSAEPVEPSQ